MPETKRSASEVSAIFAKQLETIGTWRAFKLASAGCVRVAIGNLLSPDEVGVAVREFRLKCRFVNIPSEGFSGDCEIFA